MRGDADAHRSAKIASQMCAEIGRAADGIDADRERRSGGCTICVLSTRATGSRVRPFQVGGGDPESVLGTQRYLSHARHCARVRAGGICNQTQVCGCWRRARPRRPSSPCTHPRQNRAALRALRRTTSPLPRRTSGRRVQVHEIVWERIASVSSLNVPNGLAPSPYVSAQSRGATTAPPWPTWRGTRRVSPTAEKSPYLVP